MFHIDIDARRHIVSITLAGLMDDSEALRYSDALRSDFVRKIGGRPYVMMVDTTRFGLQQQSVVALFAQRIALYPKAHRIALVNGRSLIRMQLKRLLPRNYARYFDTVDEALPWLLDGWPHVADTVHSTDPGTIAPQRRSA